MKGNFFIPGLKVVLTSAVLVGTVDADQVQINVTGLAITRTLVGSPDSSISSPYYRPINQTGTITLKLHTAGKRICASLGEMRQDIPPEVLAVDDYGRPTKLKIHLRHWLNCEQRQDNGQERSLMYTEDVSITEPDWDSPRDLNGLPCVASITETSTILGGDREWEGASGQIVSVGTINNCSVNTFTMKGIITVNKP